MMQLCPREVHGAEKEFQLPKTGGFPGDSFLLSLDNDAIYVLYLIRNEDFPSVWDEWFWSS